MHSKLRSKHKVDSKCVKTTGASMKTMEPCLARVESGQGPDNEQFYNQGTNSSKKGGKPGLGPNGFSGSGSCTHSQSYLLANAQE